MKMRQMTKEEQKFIRLLALREVEQVQRSSNLLSKDTGDLLSDAAFAVLNQDALGGSDE